MEDTNYIFDAKSYVMGARDRQGPVIKIEDEYLNDRVDGTTKKPTRTMKQRGDNLLAGTGQLNKGAVKVVQNRNYAQEQTMKTITIALLCKSPALQTSRYKIVE